MLKTLGIVVAAAVAAVLIYAGMQPDTFTVRRTLGIKAPPEKIFPLLDDFQKWGSWSPYEKMDPTMKRSFSSPSAGKGAAYEWSGNDKVGAGRMEITDATAPSKVAIKLDFKRPMEAHNTVEFTLEPRGTATDVTWSMQGSQPFSAKLLSLAVSMDQIVGKDFETGLASLKTLAEQ